MRKRIDWKMERKLRILLISFLFLLSPLLSTGISGTLEVYFIDVGHGNSIFIITPNNKTIPFDAGVHSAENDKRNSLNYIRGLKKKGRIKGFYINVALITHPHDDHYGGFSYLYKEQGGGQDFAIENI